ncbi:Protein dead ringer-like protein [Hypsibius exemplaris]|uniref:Protein dead ringer-like protein n=1 Tax=Hypsibius exemplaris TaxID=2072580 RepID=A0A9X6NCM3_HYPEX|nr:Protein dead ringer-like protein [Hypsibius exemplaris]
MSTAVADHGRRSRSDDSLRRGTSPHPAEAPKPSPRAFHVSRARLQRPSPRDTMEPQERDLVLARSVSNTPSQHLRPGDGEATSPAHVTGPEHPQDLSVGSGGRNSEASSSAASYCIRRLRPVPAAVRTTVAELEGFPPPRRTMRMIDRRPLAALHPTNFSPTPVVVLRGAVQTTLRTDRRQQTARAFLDDLFSFMQKRGTPVNRIPIMAKQTLDLYELYKLVTQKGGLVEVINKKIWREITKGLNLPSSITSAAFTLRTQYMKYLYPYECEKLHLSAPDELQSAIDGNKREGRRSGHHYSTPPPDGFPVSQAPPVVVVPTAVKSEMHQPSLNGSTNGHSVASIHKKRHRYPDSDAESRGSSRDTSRERQRERQDEREHRHAIKQRLNNLDRGRERDRAERPTGGRTERAPHERTRRSRSPVPVVMPTIRRHKSGMEYDDDRPYPMPVHAGLPTAHFKIASRGDGRTVDSSLVISMEINGIMYQGVLFAQNPLPRL